MRKQISDTQALTNETLKEKDRLESKLEELNTVVREYQDSELKLTEFAKLLDVRRELTENQKAIDNDEILKDYCAGFTRTAQSFFTGVLVRFSGLLESKAILGHHSLPIPPVFDKIVAEITLLIEKSLQIHVDNKLTISLNSISDVPHFTNELIPLIVSKLTLKNSAQIKSISQIEEQTEKNILVELYSKIKSHIFVDRNRSFIMKIGAQDAVKLIAGFSAGFFKVDSFDDQEIINAVIDKYEELNDLLNDQSFLVSSEKNPDNSDSETNSTEEELSEHSDVKSHYSVLHLPRGHYLTKIIYDMFCCTSAENVAKELNNDLTCANLANNAIELVGDVVSVIP